MYCFKLYFLFRNKENKILFVPPPPPKKKRRRDTNGRNVATRTYVFVYTSSLCPEFLLGRNKLYGSVKLESNPFIQNYLIIVVFHAHITAFQVVNVYINKHWFISQVRWKFAHPNKIWIEIYIKKNPWYPRRGLAVKNVRHF